MLNLIFKSYKTINIMYIIEVINQESKQYLSSLDMDFTTEISEAYKVNNAQNADALSNDVVDFFAYEDCIVNVITI